MKGSQKYPEIVREFSICLHYYSPRAYDFVRDWFNKNLPDVSTIRAWYANSTVSLGVGVNEKHVNILKQLVDRKQANNSELLCAVIFDEMYVRQHVQWINSCKRFLGFSTYGEKGIAKEALAFVVHGVNEEFQFPIAYHFITSISAKEKKQLLLEVVEAIQSAGAIVMATTFDGHKTNIAMCKMLGADLDVDSVSFKPYFETENGQRICLWFDPCHMIKLSKGKRVHERIGRGN